MGKLTAKCSDMLLRKPWHAASAQAGQALDAGPLPRSVYGRLSEVLFLCSTHTIHALQHTGWTRCASAV